MGPSTTVITGGARGTDIIAAEAGLARGAHLVLCLALPATEFEQHSVTIPDTQWQQRFRSLLARADVEVVNFGGIPQGYDVYAATNIRIIERARMLDPRPHALLVWDGQHGDGRGGTHDFVHRLGYTGPDPRVRVIDPTARRYEARQTMPGPKRLLALDGGGIRGTLTLEILRSIETELREHRGCNLVLSDYFDYIGGTSTGAIIAAALARGKSVGEIQDRYETLGSKVFKRRLFPMWLRSIYRDSRLTSELDDFFGAGLTLGDPEFRSLLLVVLHNTVSDSAWPLSNCSKARYNRAERYLKPAPDRNLDLPLTKLIRGSAAAPVYFSPESLRIGTDDFVFQDGGLTPFNNPALLMFLMATLPEYGLQWPVGQQNMLIVSVGTGSAAAVHTGLRAKNVHLLFNAKNLPAVLMRGAAVGQDLICRSLGRCLTGRPIDSEVGDRLNCASVAGESLFTYLRYDADLSSEALHRAGITSVREQEQIRKLDGVGAIPQLRAIGEAVGRGVDLGHHFQGFV
ncbi:patatin-like phospholipase family protein [Rhodococcus sp. JS3073]|uniref:patatin-like phospholipase family protein n=1 Tax=Rhodococcus sp. JS3073 TaxID=3002901 RepID=UPI0022856DDF|nr:patatin-like phospholipase family protein [Rhodococcus sp. JS3073]WAM19969.1 patatin-like phospholipase family protein [Rhodococcus sp. JS3073]